MINYRGMPGYTGANLPNDQYWSTDYKPGMGNPGGTGGGPQYNMQSASQFAPPNEGGPGNPGGASNMAKPAFQNNKGPAPLTMQDRQMYRQPYTGYNGRMGGYDGSGINPSPYGFGQGGAPTMGGQQDRGYAGDTMQGRMDAFGANQQGGMYRQPNMGMGDMRSYLRQSLGMGGDPFNQYGNAGQSQQLGRYQPPMMSDPYNPTGGWTNGGGYSYNIPNSYGSGQWNQFNSTDRASSQFGQSPNTPQMGVNQSVRYPQQSQNYYSSLLQQQPQQPRYTQPGSPEQPGPVN